MCSKTASSASRYFEKLLGLLESLGSRLTLFERYEALFGHESIFVHALTATQLDILNILRNAQTVFSKRGMTDSQTMI